MCFSKPLQVASVPLLSSTQSRIRSVEEGWTPRGPGIWTDEEFDSSDDVDFVQAPLRPVQKKSFDIIRKERAERCLKRAETCEQVPFIVQKRRAVPKSESQDVKIVQKKRIVPQTTPVIVRKVRDIPTPEPESQDVKIVQKKRIVPQTTPSIVRKVRDIVYSRTTLMKLRSAGV